MVSIYPCELHGQRIRGSLEGIRLTLLSRQSRFTRKLRVCPVDMDEVLGRHAEEWELVSDEGLSSESSMHCSRCHDEPDGSRLVSAFVYVWRRGKAQDEYYGQYCDGCAAELINTYGLVEEATRNQ